MSGDGLVVEVEEELVVEALDVLEGRDDLLEVLILRSAEDGVVDLSKRAQKVPFSSAPQAPQKGREGGGVNAP